jgi:hypothetical protein
MKFTELDCDKRIEILHKLDAIGAVCIFPMDYYYE